MTEILLALISVVFAVDGFLQWRSIERLKDEALVRDGILRTLSGTVYDMQKQAARGRRKPQP